MKKNKMEVGQVRTRQRVTDHGEVYTNAREVNAMLDLVKDETERIDSRFLEPACGHGNFLEAIMERKLDAVEKKYKRSQTEFEAQSLLGLACIYGIDIQEDNVLEARDRLFDLLEQRYRKLIGKELDRTLSASIRYVLDRNIIHGDALELRTVPPKKPERPQNGRPTLDSLKNLGKPIVFSEWSLIGTDKIKRIDYSFEELLDKTTGPLWDTVEKREREFKRVAEFPLVHYLEIPNAFRPIQS